MTNHPNRKLVRLSLTVKELDALKDVLLFAHRQGYHPLTEYAARLGHAHDTTSLVDKVNATWNAVRS